MSRGCETTLKSRNNRHYSTTPTTVQTNGQTDGRTDERTDGRTENCKYHARCAQHRAVKPKVFLDSFHFRSVHYFSVTFLLGPIVAPTFALVGSMKTSSNWFLTRKATGETRRPAVAATGRAWSANARNEINDQSITSNKVTASTTDQYLCAATHPSCPRSIWRIHYVDRADRTVSLYQVRVSSVACAASSDT